MPSVAVSAGAEVAAGAVSSDEGRSLRGAVASPERSAAGEVDDPPLGGDKTEDAPGCLIRVVPAPVPSLRHSSFGMGPGPRDAEK